MAFSGQTCHKGIKTAPESPKNRLEKHLTNRRNESYEIEIFSCVENRSGNIQFRYTKAFAGNYRIYGGVRYSYTKAFDVSYNGDSLGNIALNVGYIF